MPKSLDEMDALERLLVEKYKIDPDTAEAYAIQIQQEPKIAGGKYLQEEAAANIATGAIKDMRYLGNIPKMVNPEATGAEMPALAEAPQGVPDEDLMRWWAALQNNRNNVKNAANWAKEVERVRMSRSDEAIKQLDAPTIDMQVESVLPVQPGPAVAKERLRRAQNLRNAVFRGM